MARGILQAGNEVNQMMKVVGEEGTSLDDFIVYLKGEFVDSVYLQQDAFDAVDCATPSERQSYVFNFLSRILKARFDFKGKDEARHFFQRLTQATKDWNRLVMETKEFKQAEKRLADLIAEAEKHA